jgi:membrane-bound metal-dependent hydrolase YbcI (DUF457 family)
MTMLQHTGISAILGAGLWCLAGPWAAAACLVAGVLVDLDHLFDYAMNYPWRRFHPRHFFHAFRLEVLDRVFVLLHAWELVAAVWLAAWWSGWEPMLLGAAVGLGVHLLLDQIFNAHNPAAYLLAYRLLHRFEGRRFYGEREIERRRRILAGCGPDAPSLTSEADQSPPRSP